ncbi:uncharacterized mitochondrial protein AtMg00810-like [Nymphaea colorata]|uniref:uncharacterized mitochondrial protein AtMg00810-like n=1 Tax=Nymphaea colorata TaxID=210225 RepID=UPI00129E5C87|nr:uncharacterized mitochondrial protein AtMg00810-like [Nymphaea colorata]
MVKLTMFLEALEFTGSKIDTLPFVYDRQGILVYHLVYVDDIIITDNLITMVDAFISKLAARSPLKDLDSLHYFLGIELQRNRRALFLSQHKYMIDLLSHHNMLNVKHVSMSMTSSTCFSALDGKLLADPTPYRQAIGALQYLTLTRLDLFCVANKVCQSMHAPHIHIG